MNRFSEDVELDYNLQPVIGKEAEILNGLLPYLIGVAAYLMFLNGSFLVSDILKHSPIVNIAGSIFAFFFLMAGWILAFLSVGLIGGNFTFAKTVFLLIEEPNFKISSAVLLGSAFFIRAIAGIVARGVVSYRSKVRLFFILIFVIGVGLVSICNILGSMEQLSAEYYFMYSILGVVYTGFVGYGNRLKNRKRRTRSKRVSRKKEDEVDKWKELKNILGVSA